ncbi:hypothetical protein ACFLT9_02800 [Acidobacteriota bacterium]
MAVPLIKREKLERGGLLSTRVGGLVGDIERYKDSYAKLWKEARCDFPVLGRTYTRKEQRAIQKELSHCIDLISEKLTRYNPENEEEWLSDFVSFFKASTKKILSLSDLYLDSVFQKGFIDSTRAFVDGVKEFDPHLPIEHVYQALRNVWIMNSLQIYLDVEVGHSEAIFAYSLIYPYTDNFLDDVILGLDRKLAMANRLRLWLEGREAVPENEPEEKVRNLIRLIEKQFPRENFPGVYQGLLSIFNAQIRSLLQQTEGSSSFEGTVLDISLEKGGTSVLADGFLIQGQIDECQKDFCFGFGIFLQLADDIQDAAEDLSNDHMTLFSQSAGRIDLDTLANRLFHYTTDIVESKLDVSRPNEMKLKEIILSNTFLLVLEAIGKNRAYYSRDYIKNIESFFPVGFSYLEKFRKKTKIKLLEHKEQASDLDFISAFLLTALSRTLSP